MASLLRLVRLLCLLASVWLSAIPLEAQPAEAPAPPPVETVWYPSPLSEIKAILGFILLLALTIVASRPQIHRLERRLGIAHLATTGFPFLLLGLLASQPEIGVLSPPVLREIGPLLTLGLGWIGFVIGYQVNAAFVENLPPSAGSCVAFTTLLPFAAVSAASALTIGAFSDAPADEGLLRDALILGVAGAMTARSAPYLWRGRDFTGSDMHRMSRIVELERIVGVVGMICIAAYFRPHGAAVGWQLPGTAWLFLTLGVGVMLGGVGFAAMLRAGTVREFLVVLVGAISFAAGMASFLRLSPIPVCFLAGLVMANFPARQRPDVSEALRRIERPVYFLFLTIAGALWQPGDWRGWALMALFVSVRLGAKWLAATLLRMTNRYPWIDSEREWLTFAPLGALSLAIVINAQDLYSGARISWIVTAVIVGSVVTEALVQPVVRKRPALS